MRKTTVQKSKAPQPPLGHGNQHWQLALSGTRQGIGLRPKVLCLALKYRLTGDVKNTLTGAIINAFGKIPDLEKFTLALSTWLGTVTEPPIESPQKPHALTDHGLVIRKFQPSRLFPKQFTIASSDTTAVNQRLDIPLVSVQSDQALCKQCLAEFNDPQNRRFHYPFISCAQCGPRFSILKQPPFDRTNTSFAQFPRCTTCEAEYRDTADRRCHAQTCSCPDCGPKIWFLDTNHQRRETTSTNAAIKSAGQFLQNGEIITLKTPTGFQLVASAHHSHAIEQLRQLKNRPYKPFAVMFPDITDIADYCNLTPTAEETLQNTARPIVLLTLSEKKTARHAGIQTSLDPKQLAPGLNQLGCFLPTTGLHHLLLKASQCPLVITSGNLGGDWLASTNTQAIDALQQRCRYFLLNNLDIHHPIDDSVVQIIDGDYQILRRARGFVPHPIPATLKTLGESSAVTEAVGLGGGEKTSFALLRNRQLYLSQAFGDLALSTNIEAYRRHLKRLGIAPIAQNDMADEQGDGQIDEQSIKAADKEIPKKRILCYDQHPNYPTTLLAHRQEYQATLHHPVQHHISHFFAALNEYGLTAPTVGIIWDGAGLGTNGHIWGGEFFVFSGSEVQHVGQLMPFPLLGRDGAAKFPYRNALSLVQCCVRDGFLPKSFLSPCWWTSKNIPSEKFNLLSQYFHRYSNLTSQAKADPNYLMTSSVGRLFDGVAALLNLCHKNTYEGEAALRLMNQALLSASASSRLGLDSGYPFSLDRSTAQFFQLDWRPAITAMIKDLAEQHPHKKNIYNRAIPNIANRFHLGLAQTTAELGCTIAKHFNCKNILVSGGTWQNKLLCEYTRQYLNKLHASQLQHAKHSKPYAFYIPRQTPPNDAGLAIGQIVSSLFSSTKAY